jgi:hypothetical protein
VTDKALEALKALPHLRKLSLDHTNITDRAAESQRPKVSFPRCLIFYDE